MTEQHTRAGTGPEIEDALSKLRDLREGIDRADATSLGGIPRLLDDMARDCDIAMATLERALRFEVDNCPDCKDDGFTINLPDHLHGLHKPEDQVDCTRCAKARAAIAIAEGGGQ